MKEDFETLRAALIGYNSQRDQIDQKVQQIKRTLQGIQPEERTHKMSDAGRKRIAAAQRKRWAQARAAKNEEQPKRRLVAGAAS